MHPFFTTPTISVLARHQILLAAAFLVLASGELLGQFQVGTLSNWDGQYEATGFSDTGNASFGGGMTAGQTFRINNGPAQVTGIKFPVICSTASGLIPGDFQVGVAAWNGIRPVGAPLYLSEQLHGIGNVWQNFSLTPNNLILTQGQDYVLFFTAFGAIDGFESQASMGYVPGNIYSGGQWCFLGAAGYGLGVNNLFTEDWTTIAEHLGDLAFQINYQVVPEPATSAFICAAAVLVIWQRRLHTNSPVGVVASD